MNNFALIFLILVSSACGVATTRPKLEMSLATTAYNAAIEAQAHKLAPTTFRKAEYYFLRAKSSYRRKYFNKALQYAKLSQMWSEKAEYLAQRETVYQNANQ